MELENFLTLKVTQRKVYINKGKLVMQIDSFQPNLIESLIQIKRNRSIEDIRRPVLKPKNSFPTI